MAMEVVVLVPAVEEHDDPSRVIGRRTKYLGTEHPYLRDHVVVVVAVLKDALKSVDEWRLLTTEDEVRNAGGVGPDDRIEVSPFLPKEGRLSFATSDPKAVDLEAFVGVARHGAGARRRKRT